MTNISPVGNNDSDMSTSPGVVETARNDHAPSEVLPSEADDTAAALDNERGQRLREMPLLEALQECLPRYSALRDRVYLSFPSEETSWASIHLDEDHARGLEEVAPADVWSKLEQRNSKHAVLVVEDINDEWCKALCTRYPDSIDERFLLEHVLGLVLARRWLFPLVDELQQRIVESSPSSSVGLDKIRFDLECVTEMLAYRSDRAPRHRGFHISSWREPEPRPHGFEQAELLGCMLQKFGTRWTQANSFISCCQLEENLRKNSLGSACSVCF